MRAILAFRRSGLASRTSLDVAAFVVPAAWFVAIPLIGRLIATEILLLGLVAWLWRTRDWQRPPAWFVIAWAGWLISQVITDVVVGSAFRDYARGWAGIAFTLTNFTAIFLLVTTPQRVRLFATGLGVGGLIGLVVAPHPFAVSDPWQWGIALPFGLILAAALSGSVGDRRRWLAVAIFAAFGVLNVVLGYRSLGGISVLVAVYLSVAALFGRRPADSHVSVRRAVVGLALLAGLAAGLLGLYSLTASQGFLGTDAQDRYERQGGAFGALLGGRPEALVSSQAILDSPVIGHGSWAKDPYYADLLAERQAGLGYEVTPDYIGADLIPAHSYLMGSWVWAGFLGGLFWLIVAAVPIWFLARLYSVRIEGAPLLVFLAALLLWDIAFSPYGLGARITGPFGLVACLIGLHFIRGDAIEGRVAREPTTSAELRPKASRGAR